MDSERAAGHERLSSGQPPSKGLTFERAAYTVSAPHESHTDEADDLMVKHFLNTLAEISLAVASRKVTP